MKHRRLFPLGKAYDKAFCNRIEETKRLITNIEGGKHTFLVAPRRYGKSSLCENVFKKIDYGWSKADFHLAITEKDAARIILLAVADLIGKSIGASEKILQLIKTYTKKLNPKLLIGTEHLKLELALTEDSSPAENISEALLMLEKLLQKNNKTAVLLLDEFQEIGSMEKGKAIEGAVRHAAQETQQLALIFSGSNPHLLKTMFEDERRPLYKLCRKIVLDRIHEEDYKKHLNNAAKIIWNKTLDDNVFQQIMMLTDRHPYYVNYLCDELCLQSEKPPTVEQVNKAWRLVIEEERSDLLKDFFSLSDNQRKIMIHIANHGSHNLFSIENTKKLAIASSSIARALSTLVEKDYLEKVNNDYRIIVPAFVQLLKEDTA